MQNIQNDIVKGLSTTTISSGDILPKIPAALFILLAGFIAIKIISRFLGTGLRWTSWPLGLQEIMAALIRVALWGFLVITILQVLGLTSVALALTGSFAILLLGFSSGISATVSDLVSGLQLANDKDFRVGYKVMSGDQKTKGIVREMDVRKTRIEDSEGHLHVIPNSLIEKNEWVVLYRHVNSEMPSMGSAIIKKATSITKKGSK